VQIREVTKAIWCRYADVVVHRLLEAALRLDAPPVLLPVSIGCFWVPTFLRSLVMLVIVEQYIYPPRTPSPAP